MITEIQIVNFKRFGNVTFELGEAVVFIGPNNKGKTTALQALALWEIGLKKWSEKKGEKRPSKRSGVVINRNDLTAIPIPAANLLWHDLHVRDTKIAAGKKATQNVRIDIIVKGITEGRKWECGLEFDYANEESLYCRPKLSADGRMPIPEDALGIKCAFLPPMSGLIGFEDKFERGSINVRIGEGRTAEVLRNLCYQLSQKPDWEEFNQTLRHLFGVNILPPKYLAERGQLIMSYIEKDKGPELDLSCAGRGLQQTMLILAHLYLNQGSILLLDEPDAHLEFVRQRETYQILTDLAGSLGCQVIMASHSEVLLNEAARKDMVIAFLGKPRRIDDRGSQLLKSLKEINWEQYYLAEQTGWVLYLEGSTDLTILSELAKKLNHSAALYLERPFVHFVGNQPSLARNHYHGLREAKRDLVGVAIFDRIDDQLKNDGGLLEIMWEKKEIENYLCSTEALVAFAAESFLKSCNIHANGNGQNTYPLLAHEGKLIMQETLEEFKKSYQYSVGKGPFDDDVNASVSLDRLFEIFYQKMNLPNLMRKTNFHRLVKFISEKDISPEIESKLNAIVSVANQAKGDY